MCQHHRGTHQRHGADGDAKGVKALRIRGCDDPHWDAVWNVRAICTSSKPVTGCGCSVESQYLKDSKRRAAAPPDEAAFRALGLREAARGVSGVTRWIADSSVWTSQRKSKSLAKSDIHTMRDGCIRGGKRGDWPCARRQYRSQERVRFTRSGSLGTESMRDALTCQTKTYPVKGKRRRL
ncbi:hypothetical protein C8R44DRAFT_733890 [Mycena epipterygia]|nr:hypothetical protein C8R44DRAFT_733890 [Mycena epipterygia]